MWIPRLPPDHISHNPGNELKSTDIKQWSSTHHETDHIEICIVPANWTNCNHWTGLIKNEQLWKEMLEYAIVQESFPWTYPFSSLNTILGRNIIFHATMTSSIPETVRLWVQNCLPYLYTSPFTSYWNQSLSISHSTNSWCSRGSTKIPPNTSTTSTSSLGNLKKVLYLVHTLQVRKEQLALLWTLPVYNHHLSFL